MHMWAYGDVAPTGIIHLDNILDLKAMHDIIQWAGVKVVETWTY